jgi:hypothetical protein
MRRGWLAVLVPPVALSFAQAPARPAFDVATIKAANPQNPGLIQQHGLANMVQS